MLSNELLGFIKRQDFNVTADSAGDDLYTWNVSLWKSAFDPSCQLAKVCLIDGVQSCSAFVTLTTGQASDLLHLSEW